VYGYMTYDKTKYVYDKVKKIDDKVSTIRNHINSIPPETRDKIKDTICNAIYDDRSTIDTTNPCYKSK
jgi:hypothetical protein